MTIPFWTLHAVIPPRSFSEFNASPTRSSPIAFIRIQAAAGVPSYAYLDSLRVNHEELIWPYPEKQFPIELFSNILEPKLRSLFPTPIVLIGSRVEVRIHNPAPDPLPVSVTFEWERSQDP